MFRPPNPFRSTAQKQTARDMNTYMPPHIEQAMAEHLQNTMPDHLKKYQDPNTYVPNSAATAIQEHMEATLPAHMKQYADAYMQQRVIRPGMVTSSGGSAGGQTQATAPASVPPPSMPMPVVGQVPAITQPENPAQTLQTGTAIPAPEMPSAPTDPDASYSFITNSAPPPHKSAMEMIPGGNSAAVRAALMGGALVILLIVFLIFKSLLSGSNKPVTAALASVVQDQQEILHLAAGATNQPGLSNSAQNFTANIQISLGSSQAHLLGYMASQRLKITPQQVRLKVSSSIDDQLSASATSGTYDATYKQIMKTRLDTYARDIQAAYQQDKGPKGRALLKASYAQINLFETQLGQPDS